MGFPFGWKITDHFGLEASPATAAAVLMNRFLMILPTTLLLAAATASAHPEEQCEMQVKSAPHALEFRFTFNLLTVTKCVRVDGDGDGMLSVGELKAAEPVFTSYLNEHIKMMINEKPALWGGQAEFHYLWPRFAATPPLGEEEYAGRHLDVSFVLPQKALVKVISIRFEVFQQTGPRQLISGRYEQDGRVLEVPFSSETPEHIYYTGYVEESAQIHEPFNEATKPAGSRTNLDQKFRFPKLAGGLLLAGLLLTFGYLQARRRRRF